MFYLGFLPPDCLDTHGLCIMGQSEQRNNNQKALINTGGFLLYACIPLQMSVYIYTYMYIHPKQANLALYTCEGWKAKAAETPDEAPDAKAAETVQNVGLHFSFLLSVGLKEQLLSWEVVRCQD